MVAEGLRLEDWIGKWVTVNILRRPGADSDEKTVGIEGFLEGVDPMGVIVLFSVGDVQTSRGRVGQPDLPPRHVFYPWRRIQLIERVENEND